MIQATILILSAAAMWLVSGRSRHARLGWMLSPPQPFPGQRRRAEAAGACSDPHALQEPAEDEGLVLFAALGQFDVGGAL